jgi:prepilin-type N-terminal cleavage/methylation domain-containing protein
MSSTVFKRSPRKAFTLLELIVVVVVLGILAAIAIPSFSTVKQSAADKIAIQSAESVVRNARSLAAFDGAALSDAYVDQAGTELGAQYNSSTNTITISSGGETGVATINATTGAVTITTSSTPDTSCTINCVTSFAWIPEGGWGSGSITFSFTNLTLPPEAIPASNSWDSVSGYLWMQNLNTGRYAYYAYAQDEALYAAYQGLATSGTSTNAFYGTNPPQPEVPSPTSSGLLATPVPGGSVAGHRFKIVGVEVNLFYTLGPDSWDTPANTGARTFIPLSGSPTITFP